MIAGPDEIGRVPDRDAPLLENAVDDVVLLAETDDPPVGLSSVLEGMLLLLGDDEGAVVAPPVLDK